MMAFSSISVAFQRPQPPASNKTVAPFIISHWNVC